MGVKNTCQKKEGYPKKFKLIEHIIMYVCVCEPNIDLGGGYA